MGMWVFMVVLVKAGPHPPARLLAAAGGMQVLAAGGAPARGRRQGMQGRMGIMGAPVIGWALVLGLVPEAVRPEEGSRAGHGAESAGRDAPMSIVGKRPMCMAVVVLV